MRTALLAMMLVSVLEAASVPKPSAKADPLGRGYMGVYANRDGNSGEASLVIDSVIANSAAASAGLKAGDRFVEIGPLRPRSFDEVRGLVGSLRPGTRLDLIMLRNGSEIKLAIVLGDRPSDFERGVIIEP
jgi:S1-C subfamily serine protease